MRRAYALIELPLVLALLALSGVVVGAVLWLQAGTLSVSSIIAFCLALPLLLLLVLVIVAKRRHSTMTKHESDSPRSGRVQ